MSWFSSEPHWLVSALVGAALGGLFPYLFRVISVLLKRLRKLHIEGEWHEYHTTYLNTHPIVYETKWIIKKGWLKQFEVYVIQPETKMSYMGEVKTERGQLLVNMACPDFGVSVQLRYNNPLASKDQLLGLWLSFDHDIRISSGATILTRNKLSANEALRIMREKFENEPKMPLMKLK